MCDTFCVRRPDGMLFAKNSDRPVDEAQIAEYAAVSGDRNPIHVSGVGAKAFGFPNVIAHGMWTKARALAALEGRLPSAYTVDVRFKLPIPLPSGVGFAVGVHDAGFDLTVTDRKSRPHLVGTIRP